MIAKGPIVVARHGRPALDRAAGPRLDWRQYQNWWARYEEGGLADGQTPPAALVSEVENAAIIVASERLRAQQTAALAAPGRDARICGLFNEAPLPPPKLPKAKYLPKTWNILARAAWMNGHALDGESRKQARERAIAAAARLDELAADGKVFLAAHGWFNRMLRPELRKLGWVCVFDGGDRYWSHRIYEYRAGRRSKAL